jgi:hypothetical protein
MTDGQRLDFLADLMDASVRRRLIGRLHDAEEERLNRGSLAIFNRYELHRRTCDTATAFRLAVDDASAEPQQDAAKGATGQ